MADDLIGVVKLHAEDLSTARLADGQGGCVPARPGTAAIGREQGAPTWQYDTSAAVPQNHSTQASPGPPTIMMLRPPQCQRRSATSFVGHSCPASGQDSPIGARRDPSDFCHLLTASRPQPHSPVAGHSGWQEAGQLALESLVAVWCGAPASGPALSTLGCSKLLGQRLGALSPRLCNALQGWTSEKPKSRGTVLGLELGLRGCCQCEDGAGQVRVGG